jgi:glycosyltransferase involved in cell wall biosynthesis
LIRERLPGATFTIAGRSPDSRVLKAVQGLSGVCVTGKVEDVRPYLWGAKISVVPIRIGGGTRLKIYECMAAGVPVVSTTWARRDCATRTARISSWPTIPALCRCLRAPAHRGCGSARNCE